jgi:catalase (peroxidase I)
LIVLAGNAAVEKLQQEFKVKVPFAAGRTDASQSKQMLNRLPFKSHKLMDLELCKTKYTVST